MSGRSVATNIRRDMEVMWTPPSYISVDMHASIAGRRLPTPDAFELADPN
jgi:hypothetical protein